MLTYWTPEAFRKQDWPVSGFLWRPYLPAGGTVLLHGPGGAGKSQLIWQILNAVQTGAGIFGRKVKQGNALLVCVDMSPITLRLRWEQAEFPQHFDLIGGVPFDVSNDRFLQSQAYFTLKQVSEEKSFSVVAIDATGRIHSMSANSDEAPNAVYRVFRELFPLSTLIFNHHDRKMGRDRYGHQLEARGDEDSMGSANWRNYATTVLHLYAVSASRRVLEYTKSQVATLTDPVLLYQFPKSGELVVWDAELHLYLGQLFDGLILATGHAPIHDKRQIPTLRKALQAIPAYKDLTLGMLEDIFMGWCLVRIGKGGEETKKFSPANGYHERP